METQEDELRRLRHELRLRIDKAAKSAAEALQAAADLLVAVAQQERNVPPDTTPAKTVSVPEMMTPDRAAE